MLQVPEILDFPDKLIPLITEINNYNYYLLTGGRGGSKSQTVARLILWICEQRTVRVCCGRETQNTIEDSVYKIFADLIGQYSLNFTVLKNKIIHNITKSEIIFRGFKEQGRVNIKGLEGVDIFWCFVAGTKVDGRNIEDIKVGDEVLSYNHKEQKLEYRKVLRVMKHKAPEVFYKLTSSDKQSIIGTAEHPVYIKDKGYTHLEDVIVGDIVYSDTFTEQRVESIEVLQQADIRKLGLCDNGDYVYNLEVEGNNNYFANRLLVHNCDEAEAITKATLDIILPTIRKQNALVYFTMNRFVRRDAVYMQFAGDPDCLHIKINYYENKHCPQNLIDQALKCKARNPVDYDHIWEGNPLDQASDYLVSASKLDKAQNIIVPNESYNKIKCMAVDLSGQGGDLCVASLVESTSSVHFKVTQRETWNDPDTDNTKGKIINLYSRWQPNILILDADGLGYPIYVSVQKAVKNAVAFHGSGESRRKNAYNQRADGYLTLKDFIDNEWLDIPQEDTRNQLEAIKREFAPNGLIKIQKKADMKKELGESPDLSDSLMMAIYGLNYYSYLANMNDEDEPIYMDTSYDPFE